MLFLEGHCPHCNEKRGFHVFAVSDYRSRRTVDVIQKANRNIHAPLEGFPARFFACGNCIHCGGPVLFGLEIDDSVLYLLRDCIQNHDRRYDGPLPKVVCMYPEPEPPYAHSALPDSIRKDFMELQLILKQRLAPALVISGCRTILEIAVKELGGEGKKLFDRIEDLKSKAIINGVLAEWAHIIRDDGNSATHEARGTQQEAEELVEFTKLFLQYTFEFPARVKVSRESFPLKGQK